MKNFEEREIMSVHYDSLADLLSDSAKNHNNERKFNAIKNGKKTSCDGSWYGSGINNSGESLSAGINGDDILLKNLQEKIKILDEKTANQHYPETDQVLQRAKRVRINCDFGDEIDIHKIYSGQADVAWTKRIRSEIDSKHRLVNVFVNIGGASIEDCNDSLWRAAVAVKLQRDLEAAGKVMRLIVGTYSKTAVIGCRKNLTCSVVVKNFNENLSLRRTAAMCNLGFNRSAGFMMLLNTKYPSTDFLGYPLKIDEKVIPIQLREEVESGHTKFLVIDKAVCESDALKELAKCYEILSDMKGE